MAKIIIVDQFGNETLVATFRGDSDALSCAAFLQASIHPDSKVWYRVVLKRKGVSRSIAPDNIRQVIYSSVNLSDNIKLKA